MKKIKYPNVAGTFYPADSRDLSNLLNKYLESGRQNTKLSGLNPKAIIAPHAGYIYSGEVAGSAYASLEKVKDSIKKVVVFSPTHHYGFQGIAAHDASIFQTPLGNISLNSKQIQKAVELHFVNMIPEAFEKEHALEVHLPFLQKALGEFSLIPFIVGNATPEQVEQLIELLDDGETFFVISSDLSHFHDYETCQDLDSRTSSYIEQRNYDGIGHHDACGYYPLRGLLKWAADHSYKVKTVDLRNSGDTAGDRSRVVGYGSYVISS